MESYLLLVDCLNYPKVMIADGRLMILYVCKKSKFDQTNNATPSSLFSSLILKRPQTEKDWEAVLEKETFWLKRFWLLPPLPPYWAYLDSRRKRDHPWLPLLGLCNTSHWVLLQAVLCPLNALALIFIACRYIEEGRMDIGM